MTHLTRSSPDTQNSDVEKVKQTRRTTEEVQARGGHDIHVVLTCVAVMAFDTPAVETQYVQRKMRCEREEKWAAGSKKWFNMFSLAGREETESDDEDDRTEHDVCTAQNRTSAHSSLMTAQLWSSRELRICSSNQIVKEHDAACETECNVNRDPTGNMLKDVLHT